MLTSHWGISGEDRKADRQCVLRADEETSDDEPLLPATSTGSKGVSFRLPDRKPSLSRVRSLAAFHVTAEPPLLLELQPRGMLDTFLCGRACSCEAPADIWSASRCLGSDILGSFHPTEGCWRCLCR
jgi:hypothetical protein